MQLSEDDSEELTRCEWIRLGICVFVIVALFVIMVVVTRKAGL